MELNQRLDQELTAEQKIKFQKDNGRFKLLNNIVLIPIATALLGIYLESILIVSISIVCVIIFLLLSIGTFSKRNVVYEDVIIPCVLREKFENVECNKDSNMVLDELNKSKLFDNYDKAQVKNSYTITKEKYNITLSKTSIKKLHVEENDGVVDKNLEEIFSGAFAYAKLPSKSTSNFKVIAKSEDNSLENKIAITYTDFNNCYDVYTLNPVEVRNILSPGVMARILEFNSKVDKIINFSIIDDTIYISVDYDNFLEFNANGKKYINEVEAIKELDLVEIMDIFIRYFVNMYEK